MTAHHLTIEKRTREINREFNTAVVKLLENINFSGNRQNVQHVSGTMFFARATIFNLVKQLNLQETDFKEYVDYEHQFLYVMEVFIGNCANANGLLLSDVYTPKLQVLAETFINSAKFMLFTLRKFFFRVDKNGVVKILKVPVMKLPV